ncbi:MAG TPA: flagellar export protein FliJ [Bacteriovoracaceae bacterium]|nr:flagellar export protein FliJ [Bacteriovoracaceae bacterium]
MKRYQFRLEPVLKIRKFKEETCRMELGQLLSELQRINEQLTYDNDQIDNYYKIQQGALESGGMSASQLQAFPMLIAGKVRNIELLKDAQKRQEQLIEDKKKELAILRGELKVIENMKEKDFEKYRKELNKEIDNKVEEQTQNWLLHKSKG